MTVIDNAIKALEGPVTKDDAAAIATLPAEVNTLVRDALVIAKSDAISGAGKPALIQALYQTQAQSALSWLEPISIKADPG